ncbi:MAG: clan AA aspartic protease [Pyrinomonadaceae bacterium MAG19_C2-C3]|nr:clan AA aspartic protease [Pyrinomonadaceae bacterium MAG19_C2-C3]
MGEVRVKVKITNSRDEVAAITGQMTKESVRSYEADALVDTGAVTSAIPQHIYNQLGLVTIDKKVVQYADGRNDVVEATEPVIFEINGRRTPDEAFVIGDEVLIGQTVLEKMDLLVDCRNNKVTPNPARPDQPVLKVK